MKSFASAHGIFKETDCINAATYLKQEDKENFLISEKAAALYELFLKELKEKGKDLEFIIQLQVMYEYPKACYYIAESAVKALGSEANQDIMPEVAAFIITQNLIRKISNTLRMK